ncbi:MAG TPA: hypothetical protein VFE14_19405 [Micromonosporaceae bacterium]|nr:hypothetical protein [Micromonosporaceae bacterium]
MAVQDLVAPSAAPLASRTAPSRRLRPGRLGWPAAEAGVAVSVALLFTWWGKTVDVDPLTRVGQVSGLAAVQLRFAGTAAVLVVVLVLAQRWVAAAHRDLVTRLGCAAVAGLATGIIAAGVAVALHGTPLSLWPNAGDNRWILEWVHRLGRGEDIPDHYPPLWLYLIGGWAKVTGKPTVQALQDLQLAGAALYGPAAYLAWRLVLRPGWALGIGVVACLPFVEPVKPYPQITLVMLIPVVVKLLAVVRRSAALTTRRAMLLGAGFGLVLGLLFLLYSGWFVWCAPGVLVAFGLVTPWRRAAGRALLLAASAGTVFVAVSWVHLRGLLNPSGGTTDAYFYFDTYTEPAYIAMWRNDRPYGSGTDWPPVGELGGVGLFTLLLAVGLGVAIAFGWRRTVVIAVGSCVASAWFIRFWLASQAYQTRTVRLYPRTTMLILYGLLVLTGFAILFVVQVVRARPPRSAPFGLLLVPLLFFFAAAGSATADRYMPNSRTSSTGFYAWLAHATRLGNGTCPPYGAGRGCDPASRKVGTPNPPIPLSGKPPPR